MIEPTVTFDITQIDRGGATATLLATGHRSYQMPMVGHFMEWKGKLYGIIRIEWRMAGHSTWTPTVVLDNSPLP